MTGTAAPAGATGANCLAGLLNALWAGRARRVSVCRPWLFIGAEHASCGAAGCLRFFSKRMDPIFSFSGGSHPFPVAKTLRHLSQQSFMSTQMLPFAGDMLRRGALRAGVISLTTRLFGISPGRWAAGGREDRRKIAHATGTLLPPVGGRKDAWHRAVSRRSSARPARSARWLSRSRATAVSFLFFLLCRLCSQLGWRVPMIYACCRAMAV